jgi:hypothetical protein
VDRRLTSMDMQILRDNCPNLMDLTLSAISSSALQRIRWFTQLERLELKECDHLDEFLALESLVHLQSLTVAGILPTSRHAYFVRTLVDTLATNHVLKMVNNQHYHEWRLSFQDAVAPAPLPPITVIHGPAFHPYDHIG